MANITDIFICNTALLLVGADEIETFEDATREAKLSAQLYEVTKDALIQEHPWKFSLEYVQLAKTTNTPLFDYKYEFQLPSNYLVLLQSEGYTNDYRIVGDKMYTNFDPVKVIYQKTVAEVEMPLYFVRALELKLASLFCVSLLEDQQKSTVYESQYERQIKRARFLDSKQQPARPIPSTFPILNARLSNPQ